MISNGAQPMNENNPNGGSFRVYSTVDSNTIKDGWPRTKDFGNYKVFLAQTSSVQGKDEYIIYDSLRLGSAHLLFEERH